jgi:hypothetical protein
MAEPVGGSDREECYIVSKDLPVNSFKIVEIGFE